SDTVIVERAVELVLNGRVLVRVQCLPQRLEDLAAGFLWTEGLIESPRAITACTLAPDGGRVEVRADVDPDRLVLFRERVATSSGCGSGVSAAADALPRSPRRVACGDLASDARFAPEDILGRMKDLLQASVLFRETGGVHAAAITDGRTLRVFAEDIGRHNAVDKAVGAALRQGADLAALALLTTGRASSDIVAKAVRAGIPAVVSRGAVTSRAIELGRSADTAVVGFARGDRMNVYTAAWRFGLADAPDCDSPGGRRNP
ncbi:MAG: formate dehydrogenase accessory sulfurtransferase FdhD, partial [Phycisphaerae bacterium]